MSYIQIIGTPREGYSAIGENIGFVLHCESGTPSECVKYPDCCIDCAVPIVSPEMYDGYSYIPFSLDMEDGTMVIETTLGGIGRVYGGLGVIEMDEPVSAGTVLSLKVNSDSCSAIGVPIIVKDKPTNCEDCGDQNSCHIRIVHIEFSTTDQVNASISSLGVEYNSPVQYSINNGKWYNDWNDLPTVKIGSTCKIGIKIKGTPNCRIVKTVSIIQKTINVTSGANPESVEKCDLVIAWVTSATNVTCVSSGYGRLYMEVSGNDGNIVEFYDQEVQGWREANFGLNGYTKVFSNGNYSTHARIKGCTSSIEGFFTISC